MRPNDEQRGLPAVNRQANIRWRAIAHGRVGMRDAQPQFWLWTIVGFMAFGVVYWYYAERELERQKSGVMAKQRAYAVTLGGQLLPMRDRVEGWVGELASGELEPLLDPGLDLGALARSKGIYLRVDQEDAESPKRLRTAANRSLHDGFTSCLFERKGVFPKEGATPECLTSVDCSPGQLCNEWSVCAAPGQPYNLRLMYRALRVLSPTWTDELHQAKDDFQVRVFERDLDKVTRIDVPIAGEMLASARYFTALLDEPVAGGLPAVAGMNKDGGLNETPQTQRQTVAHWVRLGIWAIESGTPVVRMRVRADADFVPVGAMANVSEKAMRAQQRQVHNCAIAQELRDRVATRDRLKAANSSGELEAGRGGPGLAAGAAALPAATEPRNP